MLNQAQAQKLLEPYFTAIKEAIMAGFKYYHRRYADESHRHHARSRANLVNDHIVDFANRNLAKFPGVKHLSVFGRKLFQVHDEILLHFKKLDRRKLPSNYPTLFALDFMKQKQLELPGLPATLPRLIAGFVPSKDWARVEGVFITCPDGDKVAWYLDLTAMAEQLETIDLRKGDDDKLSVPRRRRVRARRPGDAGDIREANG
jgi:hypothetical protein